MLSNILGYIVTGASLLSVQLPKRWQMLLCSAFVNFLAGVSLVLSVGLTSAPAMNFVGTAQCLINTVHCVKQQKVSNAEKIVFTVLYLVGGFLGYKSPIDMMTITGTMLFMVSTFQKNEQKARAIGALNLIVYILYYIIIRSTLIYAQLLALCSSVIALLRYKKQEMTKNDIRKN